MRNLKELFSEYEPLSFDAGALLSEEDKAICKAIALDMDTEEIMKRILGDDYIEPDKKNEENNGKTR